MKGVLLARSLVGMLALLLSTSAVLAAPPPAAPTATPRSVGLELVADGLTAPLTLVAAPDRSGRRFIVDQIGTIRILTADGRLLDRPFLNLRDRIVGLQAAYDERGLLGLAFHPDFAKNGRFFVYYSVPLRKSAPADWDHTNRLSEFKVSKKDPNRADAASERILLQMDHPYLNHNGGTVAFGSDGYLYLSVGDGGNKNDIGRGHTPRIGNGQDISKLLGKILRLDVDHGSPYGIPRDNPFVGRSGRDEIFAYGFRNPYRFSFDRGGSHQLFVGDAGQELYEEVSIAGKGKNYGWNIKEGTHCFNPENEEEAPPDCRSKGYMGEPLIDPVIEYGHPELPGGIGEVVVGGYMYRGRALSQFSGHYIFGDWSTDFVEPDGTLLVATPRDQGHKLWRTEELRIAGNPGGRLHHYIVGFGEDASGELYVLVKDTAGPSGHTGKVYKLVAPHSS